MKAAVDMSDRELIDASRKWDAVQGEGGYSYNPYEIEKERRIDAELAAERKAREAEWTREVTIARRAEWNAKARAGEFRTHADVAAQERRQRWSITDLKSAIVRHAL